LIADGCVIESGTTIDRSIIGLRCRIGRNVTIRNSILMGNDYYESANVAGHRDEPPLGIGENTVIEGAIIDKNCHIGRDARVVNARGLQTMEEVGPSMICECIPVISKNGVLPDRWSF